VRAGRSRADRHGFFHGDAPAVELSLDSPRGAEGEGEPMLDGLPCGDGQRPDELVETAELVALVRRRAAAFHEQLPTRDATVFRQRFLTAESAPLSRLAARFRLSKERVRQIEKELVGNFREYATAA
jgi:DNA-directed RNA polymerase sigma subunit (sigma70/sigma32)